MTSNVARLRLVAVRGVLSTGLLPANGLLCEAEKGDMTHPVTACPRRCTGDGHAVGRDVVETALASGTDLCRSLGTSAQVFHSHGRSA